MLFEVEEELSDVSLDPLGGLVDASFAVLAVLDAVHVVVHVAIVVLVVEVPALVVVEDKLSKSLKTKFVFFFSSTVCSLIFFLIRYELNDVSFQQALNNIKFLL